MDLLKQTKKICQEYGIQPNKRKGQNFLVNHHIYKHIMQIANIDENDCVFEVGPGLGFLTLQLSKKAKCVVSVELDDKLASVLKDIIELKKINNTEIINQDVLNLDIDKVVDDNFKVVANIPYNITSVLLRKICSLKKKPQSLTILIQKEVAQRISAVAGNMNMLALSTQFYFDVGIKETVKPSNFWPKPKVDSAIIYMTLKDEIPEVDAENFFSFAKAGFSSKRKMLKNNLIKKYNKDSDYIFSIFNELKLNNTVRAQELSLEEWLDLYKKFDIN